MSELERKTWIDRFWLVEILLAIATASWIGWMFASGNDAKALLNLANLTGWTACGLGWLSNRIRGCGK
mgnify:CR=1 FL=1